MKPYSNGLLLLLITALFVYPSTLAAQMFSVGDPEPTQTRAPGTYTVFSLGWEIASFTYTGSTASEQDQLNFDENLIRFSLETPGLDLNISLGGGLTGMNDHSYTNLNARLYNQATLLRRESFLLQIPLQITTDLKRVRKEGTDFEFQQSSLSIGTGVASALRISERLDFAIKATPNYGFSFSQGNLFGGNVFQFDGKAKLHIRNLIKSNALSIGYHFDYRSYNIEGDLNDYDFTSHSITLGIGF
jgi:hypothetical protein